MIREDGVSLREGRGDVLHIKAEDTKCVFFLFLVCFEDVCPPMSYATLGYANSYATLGYANGAVSHVGYARSGVQKMNE